MEGLEKVMDPELNISIVDLGLILAVHENKGNVHIKMTLTTMGCPLFSTIEEEIKKKLSQIPGIKNIIVELTFDPPWTKDRLSSNAKALLGL